MRQVDLHVTRAPPGYQQEPFIVRRSLAANHTTSSLTSSARVFVFFLGGGRIAAARSISVRRPGSLLYYVYMYDMT